MDALSNLTYEEAFSKLEQAVKALQDRSLDLDKAMKNYEEGMKLAHYCEQLLQQAELRVEQLRSTPDGALTSKPLDQA